MAQKHNKEFYSQAVSKYGISAQGVHWNSEFSQYKRFEILTDFIKEDISNSTIVDVGCGMGEYYNYLMDNELKPKEYFGIDCEPQMTTLAQKRYPKAQFELKNALTDTLPVADYYICSGAMNILDMNEFHLFILNCFEKSEKGFLFNFLIKESYNQMSKDEVLLYCKDFSSNIQIQENYLDNDISIFLSK